MNAASVPPGYLDSRVYSPLEMGILEDIGYTRLTSPATTVPEPGTLAFMGIGLAGAAFMRRRKTRAA